jgi:small conductance mechanosensitive channel
MHKTWRLSKLANNRNSHASCRVSRRSRSTGVADKAWFGALAIIFALSLFLPNSAVGQDSAPSAAQEKVEVVPAAEDSEIAARLERILKSTGWFARPKVTVRGGIVTLDGAAQTIEHRDWAGALAEKVEGTVAVVNRIGVETDLESTFGRTRDEIVRLMRQAVHAWPLLALAIVILAVTWLLSKGVARLARTFFRRRIEAPLLLSVVVRAFSIPVFLLGLYFVLQAAGLTRLALTVLGGTGLAGIIVGFAFRDIAENFLASILLSVRNPFRTGDLIEVAGHTGIVQNLNTRSSVLLTLDGNHVQIPNATVYKSTIKNYSSIPSRRAEFTVGIGYDSSTAGAQSIVAKILREHAAVLTKPEPLVLVDALGDATVNLRIYYWFDSATFAPDKINSALLRLSKNALLEGGIELPDPAREVVFPKGVPVTQLASMPSGPPNTQGRTSQDETSAVTASEGDLANDEAEVSEQAQGSVPEADENFLSD